MTGYDPLIIFGIIVALALNFINGLTDAAQGVATVVATRALSPAKAVFLTGICNMAGPFVFTTAVAATIGTAIVHPSMYTPETIILSMLVSTTIVFCGTRIGLPLSSSHALIGGLVGSSIAAFGFSAIIYPAWTTLGQVAGWSILGALIGAGIVAGITVAFQGDFRLGLLVGSVCGAGLTIPFLMIFGVLQITGLLAVVLFIFISPVLGAVTAFLFDVLVSQLFKRSRQNRMKRIFSPLQIA
ncbi:MAG: inorganic phosphate transporter, partial [Methanoregula sp.]